MAAKPTIWIFAPYEASPGEAWRRHRTENLARALVRRGFRVVTWMSCFSHHTKSFRAAPWSVQEMGPDWKVIFVPATSYRKNIDVGRLRSEVAFARNLERHSLHEPSPECIVVREPPQIVGHVALKIARRTGAKVISDVYDLWPEFFHQVLPKRARPSGKLVFANFYRWRKRNWDQSDAVCALAADYLNRALDTSPVLLDRPHGVFYNGIDVQQFRATMSKPGTKTPPKKDGELWAIYAGSMGNSYDIACLAETAKILGRQKSRCRILVAGAGPLLHLLKAADEDPTIPLTYLGKLSPEDLLPIYGRSDIGLCTYANVSNVEMPDKFYDYSAAGLPIVNSLRGEVARVIETRGLGLMYEAGSATDLVAKIQTIADDDTLRREQSVNSWKAASEYDATHQFDLFVDLISEVLTGKPVAAVAA